MRKYLLLLLLVGLPPASWAQTAKPMSVADVLHGLGIGLHFFGVHRQVDVNFVAHCLATSRHGEPASVKTEADHHDHEHDQKRSESFHDGFLFQ